AVQRVRLLAFFAHAARAAALLVDLVVGPHLTGADLCLVRRNGVRGQDLQLVRRRTRQVGARGDEVLGFAALEAQRVGAKGGAHCPQLPVAGVLVRLEDQIEGALQGSLRLAGLRQRRRRGGGSGQSDRGQRRLGGHESRFGGVRACFGRAPRRVLL